MNDEQSVGGYRLLRRLGTGGAGTVWLAEDAGGQRVALKLLHPALASTDKARERLVREARIVNSVSCEGVAHVLDIEVDAAQPFVVTEFVEGPNLAVLLEHGAVHPRDLASLARCLHSTLTAVHAARVIHRDVKPSNIICADTGPVLIDFGIALAEGDQRLTSTGLLSGTAGFTAPELLVGESAGPSSDWWALGATLLNAATGRQPYGIGASGHILMRVMEGRSDVAGLSPAIVDVLTRALTPDVSKRPSSDRFVDEFEAACGFAPKTSPWRGVPQCLASHEAELVHATLRPYPLPAQGADTGTDGSSVPANVPDVAPTQLLSPIQATPISSVGVQTENLAPHTATKPQVPRTPLPDTQFPTTPSTPTEIEAVSSVFFRAPSVPLTSAEAPSGGHPISDETTVLPSSSRVGTLRETSVLPAVEADPPAPLTPPLVAGWTGTPVTRRQETVPANLSATYPVAVPPPTVAPQEMIPPSSRPPFVPLPYATSFYREPRGAWFTGVALLVLLSMVSVLGASVGSFLAAVLIVSLAFLGRLHRVRGERLLRFPTSQTNGMFVLFASSPLHLLAAIFSQFVGLLVGACVAGIAWMAVVVLVQPDLTAWIDTNGELGIGPSTLWPIQLMLGPSSAVGVDKWVHHPFWLTVAIAGVSLMLIMMWIFPTSSDLRRGVGLVADVCLPYWWTRGLAILIISVVVVATWWILTGGPA